LHKKSAIERLFSTFANKAKRISVSLCLFFAVELKKFILSVFFSKTRRIL